MTRFHILNEHPKAFPLLQLCTSPTAATTAATPMNSAERSRTHLNESPMIYWPFEPTRTMLNGPKSHGMQGVRSSNLLTSTTRFSRFNRSYLHVWV
jgi:hypothetical protein